MPIKLFQNPRNKKIFLAVLAVLVVASFILIITLVALNFPEDFNGGT